MAYTAGLLVPVQTRKALHQGKDERSACGTSRHLLFNWRCSFMSTCKRCKRKLRSQKSIDAGMGTTCKRKSEEEAAAEFEKNQMTIYEVLDDAISPIQTA